MGMNYQDFALFHSFFNELKVRLIDLCILHTKIQHESKNR
jgi:hypothetical protein